MKCAPVGIITLNRYECLKTCIDSLRKNDLAQNTEVYISVDYLPDQKYYDGYNKVKKYLKGEIDGFKNVNVVFHEKNLGAYNNLEFLISWIEKKYDKYIILEDDTEVSYSFLDFCDKGLEMFEQDDTVLAINASDYVWCGKGYTPPVRRASNGEASIEKRQLLFHAAAFWKSKRDCLVHFCNTNEIVQIAHDVGVMRKLHKKSKTFFYQYLKRVLFGGKRLLPWDNGSIVLIDLVWDIYMMIYDKYVICPVKPLIRDLGVEGNGINYVETFPNAYELRNRELYNKHEYQYTHTNVIKINNDEIKLHDMNLGLTWYSKFKSLIQLFCFMFFNKIIR